MTTASSASNTLLGNMGRTFWLFGLSIGAIAAIVLTAFITTWEWIENPGGIFRDAAGTNWGFIYDTAISWFVPTFLGIGLLAAAGHLLWGLVRNWKSG